MGDSQAVTRGTARIVQSKQHELSLQLIEAVHARPILYDSKRADYRDVGAKSNGWKEVQRITKMPSTQACQKLWKTLRDRYIRELRLIENGIEGKRKTPVDWPYYDLLGFYKNCGRAARTYSNTLRKPRRSAASVSSSDDSRDRAANAAAHNAAAPNAAAPNATSTSKSPSPSTSSSSPLDLSNDSRDSNSNTFGDSAPELPGCSGFKREPSTPAFRGQTATGKDDEPGSSGSREQLNPQNYGFSPEHKAFLNSVINLASRRDLAAPLRVPSLPEGLPLQDNPLNGPYRLEGDCHLAPDDIEQAWPMGAMMPGGMPSSNLREPFVFAFARQAAVSEEGAQYPKVSYEALDLSSSSSGTRNLVYGTRALVAIPVSESMFDGTPGAAVSDSSQFSSITTCAHGNPTPESQQQPDSAAGSTLAFRKRPLGAESWQGKRVRLDDEDSLFALALIPALKRLSGAGKSIAKARIMTSIAEQEHELYSSGN